MKRQNSKKIYDPFILYYYIQVLSWKEKVQVLFSKIRIYFPLYFRHYYVKQSAL